MMIKLIIIGLVFHTSFAFAENKCAGLFESTVGTQTKINDTIKNLAELKINLDVAKAQGLSSIELTALADNFKSKSTEFYKFVRKNNLMTKDQYIDRMKKEVGKIQTQQQGERKQFDEAQKENDREQKISKERLNLAIVDGTRVIMRKIEPGSFKMGKNGEKVDVTLTKPFEMSATTITQVTWMKIAILSNSRFGTDINIDPSYKANDVSPVESISYNQIIIWIDALNKLSQAGEPSLADIIFDHKKGDIYRLPTEAEWEFVIRGRGKYNEAYSFGNDESLLGDYAWYFDKTPTRGQLQPVAKKKPLIVDGKEFYDMHGNVWEFVQDLYSDKLSGGVDPKGPTTSTDHVVRGGSFANERELRSDSRLAQKSDNTDTATGFRLVRDLGTQDKIDSTIKNLASLKIILDMAKARGMSSIELTVLTDNFNRKSTEIYKYIRKNDLMTKGQFLNRFKSEIAKIQSEQKIESPKEDDVTIRKIHRDHANKFISDGQRVIFHRIEPGSFMMGEAGKQVEVTITKPFDMMTTLTTQVVWEKIAELFNENAEFGEFIHPNPSRFVGETNPIEFVSHTEVTAWLNALNKLSMLGEPSLTELIPDHRKGDVYRLPTEAEWEFVVRGRGHYTETYSFGKDSNQLAKYAWYDKNSQGTTHPVATRLPLLVSGGDFYDMHGNVWEWTKDIRGDKLTGGIDPQGAESGNEYAIRGGSWNYGVNDLTSANRNRGESRDQKYSFIGFRFVREARGNP